MNINDFSAPKDISVNMLGAMVNKQKSLMGKYHDIEKSSGMLQTEMCPVDIDSKEGQARLKDFSWRITEELMEALEAFELNDQEHFEEELIDALHFMLEQHVLANVKSTVESNDGSLATLYNKADELKFSLCLHNTEDVLISQKEYEQGIRLLMVETIKFVGLSMNCLKNKPWKQTHMLTDSNKFYIYMNKAFIAYIALVSEAGIQPRDLYNLYFRKAQVNNFRQDSRY